MVYWLTGDVESLHKTVAVARAAVAATHAEYSGLLAHLAPQDAAFGPGRGEHGDFAVRADLGLRPVPRPFDLV